MNYKVLGKTGLMVSEIGLGGVAERVEGRSSQGACEEAQRAKAAGWGGVADGRFQRCCYGEGNIRHGV